VGVRRLALLAGLGTAVVPVLYLVKPVTPGSAFFLSLNHIGAHWVASGAVLAIAAAGLLQARGLRAQSKPRAAEHQTRPRPSSDADDATTRRERAAAVAP
jgi:hypothetical protein